MQSFYKFAVRMFIFCCCNNHNRVYNLFFKKLETLLCSVLLCLIFVMVILYSIFLERYSINYLDCVNFFVHGWYFVIKYFSREYNELL